MFEIFVNHTVVSYRGDIYVAKNRVDVKLL